jgi:hypothetical protein
VALELLGGTDERSGVAFLIAAEMVFAVVAACCSSPQTAELNAQARAATLMKWVKIGMVVSGGFVAAAAFYDPRHAKPLVAGGVIAGGTMYYLYAHARMAGLANGGTPTEDWGTNA